MQSLYIQFLLFTMILNFLILPSLYKIKAPKKNIVSLHVIMDKNYFISCGQHINCFNWLIAKSKTNK